MIAFTVRRLTLAVMLTGFTAAPVDAQSRGDDAILRALIEGTSALTKHDTASATQAFDFAVRGIGAVWGTTPEAQRARSLWYEESVKPFRGDPYERVMAYYYRGLLYLAARDWGNAQAAFRNSVQQDAFAEEEQYNDDVALPLFLQGWALQAQGSTGEASETYRQLKARRPDFIAPDVNALLPNVLVIAETGTAPRKVPDGVGSYKLRYFRGKNFKEARVRILVDDDSCATAMYPMEDVFWQASTRGGRQVDAIFEGKARFAAHNDNVGTALTAVASDLQIRKYEYDGSTSHAMGGASDAMGVVGIAALALSVRAKPAVDIRYWDNLPDAVHIATLNLPPGHHRLRFAFAAADGTPISALDQTYHLEAGAGPASNIVWVSSRDRTSQYLKNATGGRP
jgi:tetratricopeptide (TPR) repeat protein